MEIPKVENAEYSDFPSGIKMSKPFLAHELPNGNLNRDYWNII